MRCREPHDPFTKLGQNLFALHSLAARFSRMIAFETARPPPPKNASECPQDVGAAQGTRPARLGYQAEVTSHHRGRPFIAPVACLAAFTHVSYTYFSFSRCQTSSGKAF